MSYGTYIDANEQIAPALEHLIRQAKKDARNKILTAGLYVLLLAFNVLSFITESGPMGAGETVVRIVVIIAMLGCSVFYSFFAALATLRCAHLIHELEIHNLKNSTRVESTFD